MKLLYDMCIHLTQIKLSLCYTAWKLHHGRIHKGIFGITFGPMVKKKISSDKNWREAGRGGSSLQSQHFGRPRQVDHEVRRSRPSWLTQ